MHVTTVGLDLAKHVFQVHGIDQNGQVLIRRQLRRGELIGFLRRLPPCLIGMEACSTAHFWARELAAIGHEVRLMPAAYVKPYVKPSKSDALDIYHATSSRLGRSPNGTRQTKAELLQEQSEANIPAGSRKGLV